MKKSELELYKDYLISTIGAATAAGMSSMLEGEISLDRVRRFLTERAYTSKDLWQQVKPTVRQEEAVLIFDDAIQEKVWTDENEVMYWHDDTCQGRSVRGINVLNALYHSDGVSIPVAFELVRKPLQLCDVKTRQLKRASEVTKNEMMRQISPPA